VAYQCPEVDDAGIELRKELNTQLLANDNTKKLV